MALAAPKASLRPKAKPKPKVRPKSQALPTRRDVQTQTELRLPSKSMRTVLRSGKSERSEVSVLEDGSPMPFQLKVTKVESGESGTSDDPRTPVRRHSWELSSLDPSTWPVFGITNDGFGITTGDGNLDVERSANFGFDKPFDPNNLGSIWEGGGESSQTAANLLGARMAAGGELQVAQEENESFRHLCWDLIALGRDLEDSVGFQEPPNHEQLLMEARRCLEVARERLELRKQETCAVPEMEVLAPETTTLRHTGSAKLLKEVVPGSCSLPARPASPERRLTASCSVPALPWSACCPVAPRRNSWVAPQRFISDGVATYPCEPVTRSASPLRDSPLVLPLPSATAPAGAPPLRRVATPLASVRCPVQRHYRQLWIGSWITRSSVEGQVVRFASHEGTMSRC